MKLKNEKKLFCGLRESSLLADGCYCLCACRHYLSAGCLGCLRPLFLETERVCFSKPGLLLLLLFKHESVMVKTIHLIDVVRVRYRHKVEIPDMQTISRMTIPLRAVHRFHQSRMELTYRQEQRRLFHHTIMDYRQRTLLTLWIMVR